MSPSTAPKPRRAAPTAPCSASKAPEGQHSLSVLSTAQAMKTGTCHVPFASYIQTLSRDGWVQALALRSHTQLTGVWFSLPEHLWKYCPAVTRDFHITVTGDNFLCNMQWKRHTDALKACFPLSCGYLLLLTIFLR